MKSDKTYNVHHFNKEVFETFFRTHFVALCYFAQKYISDQETAKEVVHDVFINLWEKRNQMDFEKSVKSYLYASVHNRCLNYIRDHKKFDYSVEDIEQYSDTNWEEFDQVSSDETLRRINEVINQLPEKCREVFVLSRFEELKYSQIAEKLNISIKTVEAQMSKALKFLRINLKEFISLMLLLISRGF